MAGSLHGSARTTPRVRAELQASKETGGALAKHYGLSRNTVAKWRARATTDDAPMGPRAPHSTVLTAVDTTIVNVALVARLEDWRRLLLAMADAHTPSSKPFASPLRSPSGSHSKS